MIRLRNEAVYAAQAADRAAQVGAADSADGAARANAEGYGADGREPGADVGGNGGEEAADARDDSEIERGAEDFGECVNRGGFARGAESTISQMRHGSVSTI